MYELYGCMVCTGFITHHDWLPTLYRRGTVKRHDYMR